MSPRGQNHENDTNEAKFDDNGIIIQNEDLVGVAANSGVDSGLDKPEEQPGRAEGRIESLPKRWKRAVQCDRGRVDVSTCRPEEPIGVRSACPWDFHASLNRPHCGLRTSSATANPVPPRGLNGYHGPPECGFDHEGTRRIHSCSSSCCCSWSSSKSYSSSDSFSSISRQRARNQQLRNDLRPHRDKLALHSRPVLNTIRLSPR